MAVVHKDKYILSQSTKGVSGVFRGLAVGDLATKRMPWCVQTCSGRGRTSHLWLFLGPRLRKSPSAHPWLLGLPPGLSLAWLRPAYRLYTVPEVLVSSGESMSEPWLLLVLKFGI